MFLYTVLAALLYGVSLFVETPWELANYGIKTILLVIYITIIIKRENITLLPFRR